MCACGRLGDENRGTVGVVSSHSLRGDCVGDDGGCGPNVKSCMYGGLQRQLSVDSDSNVCGSLCDGFVDVIVGYLERGRLILFVLGY